MSSDRLQRLQNLSPQKRALLLKALQKDATPTAQSLSIPRRNEQTPCILSYAQQRLWFLAQLEPGSAAYNIATAVRLLGVLNVAALHRSLNEIVCRHEALRTTFTTVAGQPVQVIAPAVTLVLPLVDLQEFAEQEAKVQRLASEAAQHPFDLTQSPLLRVTLLRLSQTEHVLLLTMHHIISDGWSMGVLIRELTALYQAYFDSDSPLPLTAQAEHPATANSTRHSPLPIQYADFAVWQRQWLQTEVLPTQMSYWKQQLGGTLPVLELPTDRPRSPIPSFRGETQSFSLSPQLSEALKALSLQEGVTLFMTLLAAFQTLLYRYTAQEDILVGSPIANRNRCELEGLIGFFVNTLVLRTNLSGNPSFRELLGRVREVTLAANAHQDLPFEVLVDELQPQRDLSRNPLFQVTFTLHNAPKPALELPDLILEPLTIQKTTAQFDLSLDMVEESQGIKGSVEYSTDLFNASTITRMLEHFQTMLTAIAAHPDKHLSDLPILTATQQQQLLVEWNQTQVDYPQHLCIHQLFENIAQQTPDAIAVICQGEQFTYRELNQQANIIAHHLQALGVKPETRVGICTQRSVDIAIAILATLKAGGVYVPLDPSYPQERLALMLEDAKPLVLLTQQQLATKLPQIEAKNVYINIDWQVNSLNQQNPISDATPDNLAYIIYTSGSTGIPKGVAIAHQALVNHSIAAAQAYQLQPNDRVLQFASISFDVAAEEIFSSWLSGATVVIRPEQVLIFADFLQFLAAEQLTVLNLPTAYWHEWVTYLTQHQTSLLPALRLVIVGTESASPEKLEQWQKLADKSVRWLNAYGPTEATIGATIYQPENQLSNCVPIGRAIANTQVYILDKHLQPTPIGVSGQLYIGGDSLARGYLNQPELTAQKFIPNPFNNSKFNNRLYKTGDLARYLPDGNIEFLGRIDHQVKIRGFRIELGEIEARLNQHPHINQAVVIPWESDRHDKSLVAYITPQSNQTLTATELRSFLKEKLPEYMLPSAFVILSTLPLTPNGKLDRQSLPVAARPELVIADIIPQTEIEKKIATVWQNALNLEKIGIHDNFFEIGGNSLLIARIYSQLQKIFTTDISILDLFRYPTINSLAEHLSPAKNQNSPETNIQPEKITIIKTQQKKHLQKRKNITSSKNVDL
ncbi:MAG: amino acid adenylation domain-containing protein [Desmonostoc vinosum HA7617-LM4]|jgi:amino acid adenylation domain-containing protein|nr:amino acid adenylation domain-containing protein [Desmonostoc vinosum HA7617-LM4]